MQYFIAFELQEFLKAFWLNPPLSMEGRESKGQKSCGDLDAGGTERNVYPS